MPDQPLVLVDRDGTLIEERDYLSDPDQVRFLPGALRGLLRLKRAGYRVVVVSNQSGVGRGFFTKSQMRQVNRRFLAMLKKAQAPLDGLYLCPHAPSAHCACRKPKLGMVKRAARDLGVSWKGSISVGDRPSDVQLGQKTGGLGILVLTGYGKKWAKRSIRPDFIAKDFDRAASRIVKTGRYRKGS
jgi:histidinol-phosphate phosphatase family protein